MIEENGIDISNEDLLNFNLQVANQLRKRKGDKDYIKPLQLLLTFCLSRLLNWSPQQITTHLDRATEIETAKFNEYLDQQVELVMAQQTESGQVTSTRPNNVVYLSDYRK